MTVAFARAAAPALLLAIAACGSTPPPVPRDRVLAAAADAAREAYDVGNVRLAASLYARALDRARVADFDADVADHAYNLALCRMALGDLVAARALLVESRAAFARAGLDDADASLADARLSLVAGDGTGAAEAARRLLEREPRAMVRAEALVLLGEVAVAEHDAAAARAAFEEASSVELDPASDLLTFAHVHRLAGRVALLEDDFGSAARSFDEEARWAREGRAYRAMADALVRSGNAHRDAGASASAAERYYRAGRSFLAAGDEERARVLAEWTLALAGPRLRPVAEALAGDVEAALDGGAGDRDLSGAGAQ